MGGRRKENPIVALAIGITIWAAFILVISDLAVNATEGASGFVKVGCGLFVGTYVGGGVVAIITYIARSLR